MDDEAFCNDDREVVIERYRDHLAGSEKGIVCVLGKGGVSDEAALALEKTFDALGYGTRACSYIAIAPANLPPLASQDVFTVIEGIDPLFLVALDEKAARQAGEAYGETLPLMKPCRLFGRDARGFTSLDELLETPEGKQRAWAVLKTLPRL